MGRVVTRVFLSLLTLILNEQCVICHFIEQHKTWQFEPAVLYMNTSIVATKLESRSLIDCSTTCASEPLHVSLYYDSQNSTCYCNTHLDLDTVSSINGQYMYGHIDLSYNAATSADGNRNVTSTSSKEKCLSLLELAYTTHLLDPFPEGPYGHSLDTFNHGYSSSDWIVFQRRQDGSVNFSRYWNDYVNGFGSTSGEMWIGLEMLHNITKDNICELNITMEAESDNPYLVYGYAHYDIFSVADANENYRLFVSGFSGNVDNCFGEHTGYQFTTKDRDNDVHEGVNCAERFSGGWWYSACHCCSLNGPCLHGNHLSFANGVNWNLPWGYHYSLIKVEMMARCVFDRNVIEFIDLNVSEHN